MWNAPHCSAIRPSSTRARLASTSRAISAPYSLARPGTASMSGSSYWPMSAVYVHGTAPFSRIHATAQEVSRPPENAIPTRSPTGRLLRTLDTRSSLPGASASAVGELVGAGAAALGAEFEVPGLVRVHLAEAPGVAVAVEVVHRARVGDVDRFAADVLGVAAALHPLLRLRLAAVVAHRLGEQVLLVALRPPAVGDGDGRAAVLLFHGVLRVAEGGQQVGVEACHGWQV